MDCKTLGDYHDVYLQTDVLLLADFFETFRSLELKQYGLDPAHYFTLPGSSWDALLNQTGVELELLTDIDQHLFVERGSRGGVAMVSKRYAKANDPLCAGYDPSKPTTWIIYLDANNMYGRAMLQSLPTGGFDWCNQSLDGSSLRLMMHQRDICSRVMLNIRRSLTTYIAIIRLHQRRWPYPNPGLATTRKHS